MALVSACMLAALSLLLDSATLVWSSMHQMSPDTGSRIAQVKPPQASMSADVGGSSYKVTCGFCVDWGKWVN